MVGKKDSPVLIRGRDDYLSQLRWISKKFVVLYDVGDKRAWMIDGISALLHLVRASLKHNQEDAFNDSFLFDTKDMIEASPDRTGKAAAIFVLLNDKNRNIRLHQRPDDSYDEETTNQAGDIDRVTKKKVTYYCFKDRVDHVYHILEQMIAHQSHVDSKDGVGFKVKSSPRRQLEGFDFMDIAADEDPLWPRVVTLASTGAGWVDFARAMHTTTLFGRGFGDLFKSSSDSQTCIRWTEMPRGLDYLAVSVIDLKEILKKRGDIIENPWRLVDEIRWHNPEKIFESCKGISKLESHSCCERVQVLLPSSFPNFWARSYRSPARLEDAGAVIFGHNRKIPLRWGDSGDPEENRSCASTDIFPVSPPDSGIGSSVVSLFSRNVSSQSSTSSPNAHETPMKGKKGLITWLDFYSRKWKREATPSSDRRS